MSWVMLSLTWVEEIFPPHKPAWLVTPPSLIRGIPSLYQLSLTGGLLELESQNRLASVPAVNALGSMRIFKVSGKTVARWDEKRKAKVYFSSREEKKGEKWSKNIIIMTTTRKEKETDGGMKKSYSLFRKVADRTI